ncbi:hypothetical protein [Candidatus Ichthyocystis sparus]|nr:hypothetical protein [Candidatus Ichthyocystis sparus]
MNNVSLRCEYGCDYAEDINYETSPSKEERSTVEPVVVNHNPAYEEEISTIISIAANADNSSYIAGMFSCCSNKILENVMIRANDMLKSRDTYWNINHELLGQIIPLNMLISSISKNISGAPSSVLSGIVKAEFVRAILLDKMLDAADSALSLETTLRRLLIGILPSENNNNSNMTSNNKSSATTGVTIREEYGLSSYSASVARAMLASLGKSHKNKKSVKSAEEDRTKRTIAATSKAAITVKAAAANVVDATAAAIEAATAAVEAAAAANNYDAIILASAAVETATIAYSTANNAYNDASAAMEDAASNVATWPIQ